MIGASWIMIIHVIIRHENVNLLHIKKKVQKSTTFLNHNSQK
jgi:hypothetical protein